MNLNKRYICFEADREETEATVPMTDKDSNEDDVPKKMPVEVKKSKVD